METKTEAKDVVWQRRKTLFRVAYALFVLFCLVVAATSDRAGPLADFLNRFGNVKNFRRSGEFQSFFDSIFWGCTIFASIIIWRFLSVWKPDLQENSSFSKRLFSVCLISLQAGDSGNFSFLKTLFSSVMLGVFVATVLCVLLQFIALALGSVLGVLIWINAVGIGAIEAFLKIHHMKKGVADVREAFRGATRK